ncbi:MAG TPA: PKD domain-containing protein, partial [Chryseosolibacter sp.]
WTYGEGGNGNDGVSQNPTYMYITEGFKTLGLTVTTDQGCAHDTTRVIRVSNPPRPDFTWSKICVETETTEFKDLSNGGIGNIIEYSWDFNDGDTLGYGVPAKTVPLGTHGGRTSNTYKDPHHRYGTFQVYNVKLSIRTDDGCENAITKRIFILDYARPTPTKGYYENFENGKGTWVETSSHLDKTKAGQYSWVFGTPSGQEINSAYSGVNAWWTGGNANSANDYSTYYTNDSTEVTGPCLDLTAMERPMISLNYWSHSQENFDGAVVQYSTNGGATWRTIGDAEKRGINWYNSKNLPGAIGGQDKFAWSGKTFGWKNARFNLDEIPVAERDLVVFRIAFGSNSDNLPDSVLNGFAFDDIYIGEKKRTVLVEHFTNANIANQGQVYLDNLYTNQTLSGVKKRPDFVKVQYHLANGGFDQLNDDNPTDPATRAFIYGIDTPPTTVMDGILGPSPYASSNGLPIEFNGDHALINDIEVDRRALDDPKFMIKDTLYATQPDTGPLVGEVTFTYADSMTTFTTPVILHAALLEGNVGGNRNILRKLLWESGGKTINRTWTEGETLKVPINYAIDVPVTNPDNLYLVTFVQDKLTSYILQSSIIKAPRKLGLTPVGVEDGPLDAEIRDINVYPNPASKHVNFALENPLSGNYTYRIIDQRGVTILEGDLNHDLSTPQQVELNVLSNGIYFVQFRTQGRVVLYRKIAVMNRY